MHKVKKVKKPNMFKTILILIGFFMTCTQIQAADQTAKNEYVKTVEGQQFEAIGYNDNGMHQYRCLNCSEFVYGSGIRNNTLPDLEVLKLHALAHDQKAQEKVTFNRIYLAPKDSNRYRCQNCGEGVRESLLNTHSCKR